MPNAAIVVYIINNTIRKCSMYMFARFTVIINICMIFRHIQYHTDAYQLFYDRFSSLFKSTVFTHLFWWRKKYYRMCRLLFLSAVSFMTGLAAWLSA